MFNIKKLINEIELKIELDELRELGLTEEEICGFIEMFYNQWCIFKYDTIN